MIWEDTKNMLCEKKYKNNNGRRQQYDGYHFSKNNKDIYNPFSLFNAFAQKSYENFWFSTGTPTFLIDLLQESNFDIRELDDN